MRLTVIGSGPAAPQPDTPASGLLVESAGARLLLDCGQGVAAALRRVLDPRTLSAVVIGHMHADHYLDLAALRYLFPWGEQADPRLPVYLPPGGRERLTALATAISERRGFFDDAFALSEYDAGLRVPVGDLTLSFAASSHYVPAWSVTLVSRDGQRVVYAGDTGPDPRLSELGRGADLLICEATLAHATDDTPDRGHLALDEAIEIGRRSGAKRLLITHYPSERRTAMAEQLGRRSGPPQVVLGVPSLALEIERDEPDRQTGDVRSGSLDLAVRNDGTGSRGNGRRSTSARAPHGRHARD